MEKVYEKKYHELEKEHWWFKTRRDIILRLLDGYPRECKILEVGCSSGMLIDLLNQKFFKSVTGIDISEEAIKKCRFSGIGRFFKERAERTHFKDEEFDIVVSSDVLEHIEDHEEAIAEWRRILRKGGRVICFVPAFTFLWSSQDVQSMHYRRYSKSELVKIFKKKGFRTIKGSYWNSLAFLPNIVLKRLLRGKKRDQLQKTNKFVNSTFTNLLRIENSMITKGLHLPFGLSVFIIAERS